MKDPKHPTNPNWELFDPEDKAPPAGVELLVATKYGKLIISNWIPDGIAWGFKPGIPQPVKDRAWPKTSQLPSFPNGKTLS